MNQTIVTKEFIALSHYENVVTILEKSETCTRWGRANGISEKLTGNLNGRNWGRWRNGRIEAPLLPLLLRS
jgi:hypothetical protein